MILSSEVEVKLRCDLGWKREMRGRHANFLRGRWGGKGRPRAPKSGPRPPQDGPKTSPRRPKTPPRALLGRSWSHLGTKIINKTVQDRKFPMLALFSGRFWLPKWVPKRPQDDPKTSQKSKQKMHHFFIALGLVLDRS